MVDHARVGTELLLYREAGTETYPIQTRITTEVDGVSVVDHARVDTDPPIIWDKKALPSIKAHRYSTINPRVR